MGGWSRREFMAASLAAGAGAAGLAGCADDDVDSSRRAAASTTSRPRPGSIRDVDHVVILMQENRSFDHYFGTRRGVRGFGDADVMSRPDGRPIWYQDTALHPDGFVLPYRLDTTTTSGAYGPDPQHGWFPQHGYWNKGAMDGFAHLEVATMGYFTAEDLPYPHALADAFTLCDHSFCSVIGPTRPNRLYSMTGTIDAEGKYGGPAFENLDGPFGWETYPERLQKAGISWRVYQEEDDYEDNVVEYFTSFQKLAPTDDLYDAGMRTRPAGTFEADVAAGNLPQVSWIVTPAATSEHPSAGSPAPGIDLAARTLAALMANPKVWARTAFILSYDENGGYFDHVAPPLPPTGTPGEFVNDTPIGLGFRVPTTVCSPWTRGGRVNNSVFDHTSTLRFLETRFGVEVANLSEWRRSTCADLTEVFDFSTPDTTVPKLPDTAATMAAHEATRTLPAAVPPTPQTLPKVVS
ncbi:MAG: alkaline phosphatase family protein [Acidimicrobiales bacterium]